MEWWNYSELETGKDTEGNGNSLLYDPGFFFLEELRNITKISVRIAGIPLRFEPGTSQIQV
jgi:hypothetical protein